MEDAVLLSIPMCLLCNTKNTHQSVRTNCTRYTSRPKLAIATEINETDLVIDLTAGVQICFVTSKGNYYIRITSPLKFLHPRLGTGERILEISNVYYEKAKSRQNIPGAPTLLVTS
jgi:hypothetical protein